MTINLDAVDFSKTIVITDLHYGMRNNSKQHNTWCTEFLEFVMARAKELNIRTLLFLGDWSHNRNNVNISTLNYSHNGMKLLNNSFDNVIMLLGNHDLYFRDTLELHSIPYAQDFPNIHLIDKITTVKDFCFVPWLVGDDYKKIQTIKQPYLFCHAEIAKFRMNAHVEMPDHGGLNAEHFQHQKLVFSGHFHKRQRKGNICYIGNAFPHNYADVFDDDRGLMIWSPGEEPIFEKWPGAPKYRVYNLTEALQDPTSLIDNKTFVRITVDCDLTYERPLHFGAALAGRSDLFKTFSNYGLPLGEAFQLRDDLLGVFGDPTITGKPSGDDLREGKRTVLIALTMEQLTVNQQQTLEQALGDPTISEQQIDELQRLIRDCGAVDRVEKLITELGAQAISALQDPKLDTKIATALEQMAIIATQRSL